MNRPAECENRSAGLFLSDASQGHMKMLSLRTISVGDKIPAWRIVDPLFREDGTISWVMVAKICAGDESA